MADHHPHQIEGTVVQLILPPDFFLPCHNPAEAGGSRVHGSKCMHSGCFVVACDAYLYPVLICLMGRDSASAHVTKLSRSSAVFVYVLCNLAKCCT